MLLMNNSRMASRVPSGAAGFMAGEVGGSDNDGPQCDLRCLAPKVHPVTPMPKTLPIVSIAVPFAG